MQKKMLVVSMVIILLLNTILVGVVNAASSKSVTVYTEGRCDGFLKYEGVEVGTVRVSYYDGRVEQPAYCLERDIPGIGDRVGEYDYYNVEVQDTLTNTLIWRVVSNSYPYKSLSELGVNSVAEAFVATKQAVYCILYGNDGDNFTRYTAIGEAGERTLNLLKKLVNDARNSNTSRPSKVINVVQESEKWTVDNTDKNYVSKTYTISTQAEYSNFIVSLDSSDLPEDTRIVDLDNKNKTIFSRGEHFKVLIPINHNIDEGSFKINISAKLRTCPVYYGKAPEGLQSYALAANAYEDGNGTLNQSFSKNNSKVIIIKKDAKTNEVLKGTEFNILDSNKKIVYSNLITDSKGRITITGVEPGTYYLQEIRATDGYKKMENLVKFEMELDKEITLTVNNNKVQKSEFEENTEDINVNVEHSESSVSISKGEQNLNEINNKNDINISIKEQEKNELNNENNINISKEDVSLNEVNNQNNISMNKDTVNSNEVNNQNNVDINDNERNLNETNNQNNIDINKDELNSNEVNNQNNVDVNDNEQNLNEVNNQNNININKDETNVNKNNNYNNINISNNQQNINQLNNNSNMNINEQVTNSNAQNAQNNVNISNVVETSDKTTVVNKVNENSTEYASVKKLPKTGF